MYLNSSAKQKVITGAELFVADATVADVNLTLALVRFGLIVFLEKRKLIKDTYTQRETYIGASFV
jgi:hypothetical protein